MRPDLVDGILRRGVVVALLLVIGTPVAWAHGDDEPLAGKPPEQLGKVVFPVSCNTAAQQEFNRAMALFHSFWWGPGRQAFTRVTELDPGCGMGWWGLAWMALGNPFTWPTSPDAARAGAPAMEAALRVGARSARERDYIAALASFYRDWQTTEVRPRALALEHAMAQLAQDHPDDDEARILYALVLDATALPTDKSFANQRRAAAILEPLFIRYPDHPGVAHYLIHTYDYAGLAEQGLPAARAYAAIAPSVPHALHMPSHIFSRVGYWKEMVHDNRLSWQAAKAELQDGSGAVGSYDGLHAMDYLVFGLLQQAQDRAAQEVAAAAAALTRVDVQNFVSAYALAAIPARMALERGDWAQAAQLSLSPAVGDWTRFPQAEAILVFARALGAARSGDLAAARRDAARLEALKQSMLAARIGYWPAQADAQLAAVNGWIALAEHHPDEALRLMRVSADAEEASDKHPVTPGNVVPSRQLLGDLLRALGRPAEALAEYQRSLQRDPNRFRSLAGAAQAAADSGDRATATRCYTELQALAGERDSERPELALARSWLAAR